MIELHSGHKEWQENGDLLLGKFIRSLTKIFSGIMMIGSKIFLIFLKNSVIILLEMKWWPIRQIKERIFSLLLFERRLQISHNE